MKLNKQSLIVMLVLVFVSCNAFASICDDAHIEKIALVDHQDYAATPTSILKYHLENYATIPGVSHEVNGVESYYLNFDMALPLTINESLTVTLDSETAKHLYICNLNLVRGADYSSGKPIFTVKNGSATKRLIIDAATLTNIAGGIKIERSGAGGTELLNTTLTGDASRSGACLTISADGTVIQGSTISNCGEGVRIEANNVRIEESTISSANTCINSTGAGTVLREGDIRNCSAEGIRLAGANAVVENSEISISPRCVDILGDGAIVKGSNIHNCSSEGIRIEASNVLLGASDAAHYAVEKNVIHDNGVGIHLVRGDRNRFAYNSIYQNSIPEMSITADNGILIDAGANNGIVRPVLVRDEASGMALRCT